MEKEAVLEALGRVALVAEDHIPVRLKIGEGGVEVNVTRQDVGAEVEHLPGEFTGADEILIAFNPRYLADGVGAISGDKIRMRLIDGLKPSVLDKASEASSTCSCREDLAKRPTLYVVPRTVRSRGGLRTT